PPSAVRMTDQQAGTHYIKRLCGLPGDTLQVKEPYLLVNGVPAAESTIARVAAGKAPFNPEGYQQLNHRTQPLAYMTDLGPVHLQNTSNPAMREYAALGDNTTNSLDSRYWGPVRQFNIIGPACFTLWPFTNHWGGIE
ncbi:MAG: signal peptidase I, partial [Akkermansia sp.]|nr:signal peptidase I [Akkermansia sp.]